MFQGSKRRSGLLWILVVSCYKIWKRSFWFLTTMACSLRSGVSVSGFNESLCDPKSKGVVGFCSSSGSSQVGRSKSKCLPSLSIDFQGQPVVVPDQKSLREKFTFSIHAQASICVSRSLRWWEKTLKPNMIEIHSAQELVDALLNGGDRLIVVDFYSPGCGGCRALHPKICQLAELNPNAIFLKVNYEELKTMCHSLHIHVLPFFKLYRGAEGHLCSFSCTNATIKKFKDALTRHGTDRCSLGPAKGLDESQLLKLASMGELSHHLPISSTQQEKDLVMKSMETDLSTILSKATPQGNRMELGKERALL
ncbi:thioredoxin-like 1-1, chloroplastic [Melia azedarach]|uniref:Thioredoxin-like 1-1, chloroplastic n=1 Tax=Melia azedarach TaxID=155640 RepID=A0ACC1XNP1_MELAZ|nr:thioredoxin-like 1-1, chloroplastic [Melia azedarach]